MQNGSETGGEKLSQERKEKEKTLLAQPLPPHCAGPFSVLPASCSYFSESSCSGFCILCEVCIFNEFGGLGG